MEMAYGKAALPNWLTDVQLVTGTVPCDLTDATSCGVLWQAVPGRFLLNVPEVARYLVESGCRIVIDVEPNASTEQVIRFLRTTPLAALLYQRNIPVFHAAAVATPGKTGCILLAGDSGAGKSTLLAALLQRGWHLMADDLTIAAADQQGKITVYPTSAEVVLWNDAIDKLGVEKSDPHSRRHVFNWDEKFITKPLPLQATFWLDPKNQGEIQLNQLEGAERFAAIGLLAYNSRIAEALFDPAEYFRQASAFSKSVSLYQLCRRRGEWSADKLADRVEEII